MVEAFTGEIRLTAWMNGRVPINWHLCNGDLMSINSYPQLFSLIGTTYGGNGKTTFAVPDMRSRLPIGSGTGTSMTTRVVGQAVGVEAVILSAANLPAHRHGMNVVNVPATASLPGTTSELGYALTTSPTVQYLRDIAAAGATISPSDATITSSGLPGPSAHTNIMPSMALSYFICLNGLYPTRA